MPAGDDEQDGQDEQDNGHDEQSDSGEPDAREQQGDTGVRGAPVKLSLGPKVVYRTGRVRDYEGQREVTRTVLALLLAAVVVATALLLILLTANHHLTISEAKELAGFILSPLIGVAGTALGFYFGGHRGTGGKGS